MISPSLDLPTAFEDKTVGSFQLSVLIPIYNERHLVRAGLQRLLELNNKMISRLEIIIVDDCSTDGTWEVLQALAAGDDRIVLLRHDHNRGKGVAVRTAISKATGNVSIIYNADMEYNPDDIPSLLVPFAEEGADAVFGSRYLAASYRRALLHRNTMVDKTLAFFCSWVTNLHLSDLGSCYKAINTKLLKSIPLRTDDFRFDVEIVLKLAKRRARIFEVPVRYLPRTQEEGKKSRSLDDLSALLTMVYFGLIDDIYQEDEYGSHILSVLERAKRFNLWMGQVLRPHIGDRVLEIGAGIGNLTNQFIPREFYVVSDINPHYLNYLQSYSFGKPYLFVREIDASNREHFRGLEEQFDTALMINVLEHIPDDVETLRNLWSILEPGGRAVILVPQHPSLYGTLDESLDHQCRYTVAKLEEVFRKAGFVVEKIFDFNRFSVPGWWLNGKLLHRKKFSRLQLKLIDTLIPILKRIDPILPWGGLSIIGIGVKR
jgi:glycosyltransferase involved in cell wall biosynthesis